MEDQNFTQRVLFVCTGNCIRSQMAEGLLLLLAGDRTIGCSAGVQPAGFVHRMAIQVMQELGIDISSHRSRSVNEFLPPSVVTPTVVVTLCENAEQQCPRFPEPVRHCHWPVDDPYYHEGTKEERLQEFRRVRDVIQMNIATALRQGFE